MRIGKDKILITVKKVTSSFEIFEDRETNLIILINVSNK